MPQDLAGKTYVITGGNTGIGRVTATELARRGGHVIIASRSRTKTEPVVAEIQKETGNPQVEFAVLDLGDLTSVRACAAALLARDLPIHGLINNAGLVARGTTTDGFELIFGTNHLGHYLLTRLLLDRLVASGPARIVNVSSKSHYRAKGIDFEALRHPTRSVSGLHEYEVSKLANVLFTRELAHRVDHTKVTTYAVHPGVVATDVWRRIPAVLRWLPMRFMLTPAQGAVASLVTATAPELATETGRYYDVGGVPKHPSRVAQDEVLAKLLWERSAEWVGLPH